MLENSFFVPLSLPVLYAVIYLMHKVLQKSEQKILKVKTVLKCQRHMKSLISEASELQFY